MRSSPEGDRKALWSRPQARNPCINTRTLYESVTNPIARKGQGGDFVPFHSPRFILPCYCSFRSPSLIQPHLRRKKANSSVSTAGRTKQIRISPTQSIGRIAAFVPAAMSFSQPV